MSSLLIRNIGEFFTGDIARPMAAVTSLLVENGRIAALDPPADTKADVVIDANGSAVLPGLVDGHVHPVMGEWTPTQDAIGWVGNYLHGGTTSMVSAGELHAPGLDYNNLTPDLVTALAEVTRQTTGRVRWSNVKLHAGTVLLVPGMNETHFDRLAKVGAILAKFLFYPLNADPEEAKRFVRLCRERGIRTKIHTGGVSRSGVSQMCGFDILSWLQPDIAAHVSGGPIPMSDADLARHRRDKLCARNLHVRQLPLDLAGCAAVAPAWPACPHDVRHGYAGRHRRYTSRHAAQHLLSRVGL